MQQPNYKNSTADQKSFSLEADSLNGKVILITGATGGLGTSLSFECAKAGATLVLASRNQKKLEKLYDALINSGSNTPAIVPLEQDKAGPTEYGQLADLLQSEYGQLDSLVHCSADTGSPSPQMEIAHAEWVRVMNVNLTSARLLSLQCVPLLMNSVLGSMAFLLDHKPGAYWGGYGISKQATQAMMHMLADENDQPADGGDGFPRLAINGFDPGPMRTPLRRRAFPGEQENESPLPEQALGTLNWLISRQDRAVNGKALHNG